MWYLTWILGISLALCLAILATLWNEFESSRKENPHAATDPEHP